MAAVAAEQAAEVDPRGAVEVKPRDEADDEAEDSDRTLELMGPLEDECASVASTSFEYFFDLSWVAGGAVHEPGALGC